MNEYTFEFHRIDEAIIFVKTIASTLDLSEFSINGMESASKSSSGAPYPERWSIKVWIKTKLTIDEIKMASKMLKFYGSIDFGGDSNATERDIRH